jgi:AcrR family transcriptional regulator
MEKPVAQARRERKDMVRNLERVLQAANELFAERGNDVTMEEVARRAGVGVGTVYRRFPSKDHLFAAVRHAACDDTRLCLKQAAEQAPDACAKLGALVLTQYQRCERQSALLDLRTVDDAHPCASSLELQHLYTSIHDLLRHIITEGQDQGVFAAGNTTLLATLCLELLTPRACQHLVRLSGNADDAAAHATRFMLRALGAKGR